MSNNGNSGNGVELTLSSGFVVQIKQLPPYYIDIIEETLPFPEFPTRKIVLAAGDVAEWPYEPEGVVDSKHEDYGLYVKYKDVERQRAEISKKRDKARKDFLLANCVTAITGPMDFGSNDWVDRVESAFEDYEVPEHPGKRMLVFLKTQVITSPEELELIIAYALSQEVRMQGIINALQGFRNNMEERVASGNNGKAQKRRRRS